MDQSNRTVSTNHNLFEEKGEPKRYRTEVLPLTNRLALPLGQTGSLTKQTGLCLKSLTTLNRLVLMSDCQPQTLSFVTLV